MYKFCSSKKIIPDILVNNAGIYKPGTTAKSKLEKYENIMQVNTRGMFYLTQKLLPLLKKSKNNPRIIIISSVWALDSYKAEGRADGTIYSMSKWALRGWARSLRAELRKNKIGVTIIYPGAVFTDEWEGTAITREKFFEPGDIGKVVAMTVSTNPKTVIEEVIVRTVEGR